MSQVPLKIRVAKTALCLGIVAFVVVPLALPGLAYLVFLTWCSSMVACLEDN